MALDFFVADYRDDHLGFQLRVFIKLRKIVVGKSAQFAASPREVRDFAKCDLLILIRLDGNPVLGGIFFQIDGIGIPLDRQG